MHAELTATYRLQLTPDFDFDRAASVVPYLKRLGVSHVYLSPILQASKGSLHGYDTVDPGRISADLGGEAGLKRLFEILRSNGMAAVLDIVPNHLACIEENPWWWDVLKNGRNSLHATAFDIEWDATASNPCGKILLPVLGDHLAHVLSRNEISIDTTKSGEPALRYGNDRFPISAESLKSLNEGKADIGTLLDLQNYRLAFWKIGSDEINYRRFFNVGTLIGVRVEQQEVFDATHQTILEVVANGPVDGLRIDHPDGLRDPMGYFKRLRQHVPDLWINAEKILEPGEPLPESWPVDGTTGYDFLQLVGGLWIDERGEKAITDFYADFTGHTETYGGLVRDKKRHILQSAFEADLLRLVNLLRRIADRRRLDFSPVILKDLLTELLAAFPVYRTYVCPLRQEISNVDRAYIAQALASARRREGVFEEDLLKLLEDVLTNVETSSPDEQEFIARFQQLTSPVMAKGVEDTAFYCYDRLLALNDVGCDPARFGVPVSAFHEHNSTMHLLRPQTMLSTSTHDTKRSEDVRARLSIISEIPEQWAEQVRIWSRMNQAAWAGREPDRSAEHLLYQTLVGAWPIEMERVQAYMLKACREAGRFTSWAVPDEGYECRIREFVDTILQDAEFVRQLEGFVSPLRVAGRVNSLSQTLLKLTSPGIPDIYQGCEVWDNSLVDPDNRRDVDYEQRAQRLADLELNMSAENIWENAEAGLPKLHVIREALALRKRRPSAFAAGSGGVYQPLLVTGRKIAHVIAYSRGGQVAVITPRLPHTLAGVWEDTKVALGAGRWQNLLDGRTWEAEVPAAELFSRIPVALLEKQDL